MLHVGCKVSWGIRQHSCSCVLLRVECSGDGNVDWAVMPSQERETLEPVRLESRQLLFRPPMDFSQGRWTHSPTSWIWDLCYGLRRATLENPAVVRVESFRRRLWICLSRTREQSGWIRKLCRSIVAECVHWSSFANGVVPTSVVLLVSCGAPVVANLTQMIGLSSNGHSSICTTRHVSRPEYGRVLVGPVPVAWMCMCRNVPGWRRSSSSF
mmetsp:Transcript_33685/g.49935  ORF Transcript_33685/g.49935 Transcript_33685/m.49935 type:complete len:212 (+) Transcript_33685:927-1562(+)